MMSPNHENQSDSNIAIILDGISKQFSSNQDVPPALSKLSVKIKRGTFTGLAGSDGAGKTTLLRIIAGLLTLTEGRVIVEGFDTAKDTVQLHNILGYMPQKFGLYEDLTVLENLVLYADLRGVMGEERESTFEKLLNFTDLKRFINRRAGNLSGGMKQKLGLGCALLGNPKILLLDEPSVGVDPISRRELWKMVTELVKEGMTVIWSTAYLYEAEQCQDVIVLNEGKLIYLGEPKALSQTMLGRTIQIQNIQGNHRVVLDNAMRTQEVIDGVIQGSDVRLVLKEKDQPPSLEKLQAGPNAKIVPVEPRFEDAYMALLGGVPPVDTKFSKMINTIKKTTHSEIVISVKNLTKKFDSFVATDNISFQVKRGTIFCLLGPNGAGKSTTFKMMCGLLAPTSGSATILGIDLIKNPHLARQQIGYMAQKFSLYGDLTVIQNLQFFSGIYGLSGRKQTKTIAEMVDIFDLKPFLHTKTSELPLGFKQRLSLVCAIMHQPAILFLDEPTSGVDPIARREFWGCINELVEKGVTVVITTHFLDEAEYSDDIGLIYRGKMIATGSPDQLKQLVASKDVPNPTMEDVFIDLISKHDEKTQSAANTNIITLEKSDMKTSQFLSHHNSIRRLMALCQKEYYQIIRDPSSILMAFVFPLALIFIFGFGINLDSSKIKMGIVMNDLSPAARRLEASFAYSSFIDAIPLNNLSQAAKNLTAGNIRGFVMIQSDFTKRLKEPHGIAPVQVITDGSEPNTANFVAGYAKGAWQTWLDIQSRENAKPIFNSIKIENRYWYNPAAISKFFLVPGSIALVMTVIGALLTSLVVAREWERGTMEALLSTPITRTEFLFSKLIPYYLLGIIAMAVCLITSVFILNTPFHGSLILVFIETSLFLGSVLGLGLLLSTVLRNQFNAAQAALNLAYLPVTMLSGFVFEISSMPPLIQALTYLFPARYFVSSLQTLFMAGNILQLLLLDALYLLVTAAILLGLTYKFTRQRLD